MYAHDSEQFQKQAVRLAIYRGFAPVGTCDYCALPEAFRKTVEVMDYQTLILPLVHADRNAGITWGALAYRYMVGYQTIRTILKKRCVSC
jgi:hypothetical protein